MSEKEGEEVKEQPKSKLETFKDENGKQCLMVSLQIYPQSINSIIEGLKSQPMRDVEYIVAQLVDLFDQLSKMSEEHKEK